MTNLPAGLQADVYDDYVTHFTRPWNDYLIERLTMEAKGLDSPPKTLLDVGTGTARTLIELAQQELFPSADFLGIDYFPDMVHTAQRRVADSNLTHRITVRQGDVHQLPFAANSINLIFGRSVVHHWTDPIRAYQEIHRVLAPGGVCLIHEPSSAPTEAALKHFNELRQAFGIAPMSLTEKLSAHSVLQQLLAAGLHAASSVAVGDGLAGLGFEIRITKATKG